ncbi:hypothetical protein L1049_008857 [Liquidambar formosana]|uniref:BTB domain-containing protein n=1 Tax=Liquidambar formosana TaxID=63359 RepID=A0AAP0S709_LIQFO
MRKKCNRMGDEARASSRIGDRPTSDVVVRLRTQDGRDDWIYCHSRILIESSKYFAERLSEDWPTCQILDSRNCVEVYCQESDFDYYVNVLRLLYVVVDGSVDDLWHGVRNALGILRVAVELGCQKIVTACVNYLEAAPWEEAEEEEILRIIPGMGSQAEPTLARLQPVNPTAIVGIFLSAIRFATSSSPPPMNDLKSSAQEQLEYMLTEDDDAPLLTADDEIKYEVRDCMKKLLARFNNLLESMLCEPKDSASEAGKMQLFQSHLSDLSWACQILAKLEMMRELVNSWMEASEKILEVVEQASLEAEILETKLKVIEAAVKVLEAIGDTEPLIYSVTTDGEDALAFKFDGELWQSLESAFVSIILALPSGDQAEILTEWLGNAHIQFPDLTEAFEATCEDDIQSQAKTLIQAEFVTWEPGPGSVRFGHPWKLVLED